MKLSKKAEYALRALVAMGRDASGRSFSIQEVASSEKIPLKFLEQILLQLKNGGVLRSKRGVGGGYQFARPVQHISLGDVVEIIDGPAELMSCSAHVEKASACECGVPGACALGRTFYVLRQQMQKWLKETSIAQVIEKEGAQSGMVFDI